MGEVTTTTAIDGNAADILSQIADKTTNDIILFAIIILIGLILVALPLFKIGLSNRTKERKLELDERNQLIAVIERNTSAFTDLKATIKNNNDYMSLTMDELKKLTSTINADVCEVMKKQDDTLTELRTDYATIIDRFNNLDASLHNNDATNKEILDNALEVLDKQNELMGVSDTIIGGMTNVTDAIHAHEATSQEVLGKQNALIAVSDDLIDGIANVTDAVTQTEEKPKRKRKPKKESK